MHAPGPDRPGSARTDAVGSGALFGTANLLWRFGEGPAVAVAAVRLLTGGVLLLPVVFLAVRAAGWGWLREPWARAAVAVSAAGLLLPVVVFRLLPLNWQLATIAVQPAAVAVLAAACGGKHPGARVLALTAASTLLALSAQLGAPLPAQPILLLAAAGMLLSEGLRVATNERAMERSAPPLALAVLPALLAAPVMVALALTSGVGLRLSAAAVAAGVAVAVCGTCGRWRQAAALKTLPAAVVMAVNTSVQLLVMAVVGRLVFDDRLTWPQAACLAGSVVLALRASSSSHAGRVPPQDIPAVVGDVGVVGVATGRHLPARGRHRKHWWLRRNRPVPPGRERAAWT